MPTNENNCFQIRCKFNALVVNDKIIYDFFTIQTASTRFGHSYQQFSYLINDNPPKALPCAIEKGFQPYNAVVQQSTRPHIIIARRNDEAIRKADIQLDSATQTRG